MKVLKKKKKERKKMENREIVNEREREGRRRECI